MHEVALAENILDIVNETAQQNGARRVAVVRMSVGQMTCVEPESLEFAFQALSQGTVSAGARLEFEYVPLQVKCACGHVGAVDDPQFIICGKCHSNRVEILAGRDITVKNIEVDDA